MAIDWTDVQMELSAAGREDLCEFVYEMGGRDSSTLESAKRRAEYWKAEHAAANAEIERLRTLARDAGKAWDMDQTSRVGKLLIAMIDEKFSAVYRPELSGTGAP